MNRRRALRRIVTAGTLGFAGCVGAADRTGTAGSSDGDDTDDGSPCQGATSDHGGPQRPYDSLLLHRVPAYVTEYADSVIVRYRELDAAARRAVGRAVGSDDPYRQCTEDRERTDVMALFAHVERRWQQTARSPHDHTYLRYEGEYHGITIVQEGDFIRVDSIPCTQEACPTTPTPSD